ncbi:MAG TPA: adenylate/guanylate cyclase domain-containing protein [Bradyrhizobium sp.]|jgi:adenylate cyclase
MIRSSIRRQILGIAVGLIVLMVIVSALSTVMTRKVAHQLDELTSKYVEANNHLARMQADSLERSLELRRMVIARMQSPPDEAGFAERKQRYEAAGAAIGQEANAVRVLINAIIDDLTTESDNAALGRIDSRIEDTNKDMLRYLDEEHDRLFPLLEAKTQDFPEIRKSISRIDALRDELNQRIDGIRFDMIAQVRADAAVTMRDQKRNIAISAVLTALAAILGLTFSMFVSSGITRPVRRLLDGTRAVEAGQLDGSIDITTRDEIGQLTAAFNAMVARLRRNERMRETFGRYIDPRVVETLVDRPALAATDGQRRVMTVLFCDMKGFTSLSEGMTPQGLVKVMNHFLTAMSEQVRTNHGVIDKYIGDAVMAYWGPPFTESGEDARLASLAALGMLGRIAALRTELPELLGVRAAGSECDVRIGIATGEVLVGSIGSEFMMSYTVMGDPVNLASRLVGANKVYGTSCLISEVAKAAAGDAIETREVDRLVVAGQGHSETVFEILAGKGGLSPEQSLLRDHFAEGLAAYRARRWDDARRAFRAALEAVSGDEPSKILIKRIEDFEANPPPADWDGAWHFVHK